MARIATLLEDCAAENTWANRGPVYHRLADAFAEHLKIPQGSKVTPCSNGGVALEAMARLHEQDLGRPLRWVGSSFSFQNMGRGYFADITFIDCDASGLLSLDALNALDPDSFDGVVVVNTLGMGRIFPAISILPRGPARRCSLTMLRGCAPACRTGLGRVSACTRRNPTGWVKAAWPSPPPMPRTRSTHFSTMRLRRSPRIFG